MKSQGRGGQTPTLCQGQGRGGDGRTGTLTTSASSQGGSEVSCCGSWPWLSHVSTCGTSKGTAQPQLLRAGFCSCGFNPAQLGQAQSQDAWPQCPVGTQFLLHCANTGHCHPKTSSHFGSVVISPGPADHCSYLISHTVHISTLCNHCSRIRAPNSYFFLNFNLPCYPSAKQVLENCFIPRDTNAKKK